MTTTSRTMVDHDFFKSNNKSSLALHLRKVCARKPLKCDRCRKRFPKYDWYVEHRQWHIKTDLDRFFKWYGLYAYPCFYCSTYFGSVEEVFEHIHQVHAVPPHLRAARRRLREQQQQQQRFEKLKLNQSIETKNSNFLSFVNVDD